MDKRRISLLTLGCVTLLAIGVYTIAEQGEIAPLPTKGDDPEPYALDLSVLSETNKSIITPLGNEIRFEVSGFDGHTFQEDAYIYNITPISGLLSLSVTSSEHVGFDVDFSFESPLYYPYHCMFYADSEPTDFDGNSPTFFRLHLYGDEVEASSFSLTYSCSREAPAYTETVFYYQEEGEQCSIEALSFYDYQLGFLQIPKTHNGKKVTKILEGAIDCVGGPQGSANYELVLPNTLEEIESNAIDRFSWMENHILGVTFLSEGDIDSFLNLKMNLDSGIYYPMNNWKLLDENYQKVEELTIPRGTTCIEGNPFYISLNRLTLPYTLVDAPSWPYPIMAGQLYVEINEENNYLSYLAGLKSNSLHFLDLNGDEITEITVPSGTSSVENLFRNAESIRRVNLPEGLESIGEYAFVGCSSLQEINIPESVESIGGRAFKDCDGLTSITIPAGVTSIGAYAFYGCDNLANVYFQGTREQWNSISFGSNAFYGIYAPTITCIDD